MRRNKHRTPDNIRQNEQSSPLITQKETTCRILSGVNNEHTGRKGYTRIKRLTGGVTRSGGREGRIVLAQSEDNEAVNRLHREYRRAQLKLLVGDVINAEWHSA